MKIHNNFIANNLSFLKNCPAMDKRQESILYDFLLNFLGSHPDLSIQLGFIENVPLMKGTYFTYDKSFPMLHFRLEDNFSYKFADDYNLECKNIEFMTTKQAFVFRVLKDGNQIDILTVLY